jgi:hypothetical protein
LKLIVPCCLDTAAALCRSVAVAAASAAIAFRKATPDAELLRLTHFKSLLCWVVALAAKVAASLCHSPSSHAFINVDFCIKG